jgi:hypothetical protein
MPDATTSERMPVRILQAACAISSESVRTASSWFGAVLRKTISDA